MSARAHLGRGEHVAARLLQADGWRLNAAGEARYLDGTVLLARDMLARAATMTVTLAASGTNKVATVRVINETGHKLPTGYPEGRQMWIYLRAYDAEGQPIFKSGAYDPSTGRLTRDAQVKVYEVKQGITPELAALLGQSAGKSFHFVLNNITVKDNRIPPRGYVQALYDRPGLRPVGTVFADGQYWDDTVYVLPLEAESVLATLYYQTASREYVDFLVRNGGVDGEMLDALWQSSKSPPVVVTGAAILVKRAYLPLVLRGAL